MFFEQHLLRFRLNQLQNSAENILVNGSPDLKTVMREIDLSRLIIFIKYFLQILTHIRGSRSSHIFVFFYQNAITETKRVKPLRLMVSTKSAHLLPDNSLEAFNSFCCTWKPVKFQWKHLDYS